MTYITLNDGTKIPQLGLGVYMISGDPATEKAVSEALKIGYRHIDTAHAYQNERSVGAAVRKSGVPREEIWITTKLWPSEYGEGKTMAGIDKMLQRPDTDYIDLFAPSPAVRRLSRRMEGHGKGGQGRQSALDRHLQL